MNTNLEQLEQKIITANDAYRSGSPIMSDVEYDQLIESLYQIDPKHPLLCKSVIEGKPQTRKEKLPIPMYSLNKVKNLTELINWARIRKKFINTTIHASSNFFRSWALVTTFSLPHIPATIFMFPNRFF